MYILITMQTSYTSFDNGPRGLGPEIGLSGQNFSQRPWSHQLLQDDAHPGAEVVFHRHRFTQRATSSPLPTSFVRELERKQPWLLRNF